MKTCTKCGETKDESEFHKRAAGADGLRAQCKACIVSARQAFVNEQPSPAFAVKACTKCGKEKSRKEFSKNKNARDGLASQCRACESAYHKEVTRLRIEQRAADRNAFLAVAKPCSRCRALKPPEQFDRDESQIDGRRKRCKSCGKNAASVTPEKRAIYSSRWRKKNPEKIKEGIARFYQENPEKRYEWGKLRKYGLTYQQYNAMLESQNRVCAICKGPSSDNAKNLCVDHDHATGKVRALLCRRCNCMLGFAKDNTVVLQGAILYLNHYGEKNAAI